MKFIICPQNTNSVKIKAILIPKNYIYLQKSHIFALRLIFRAVLYDYAIRQAWEMITVKQSAF
jgi:hypothetical protein